jgi:hypothetical protein
MAFRHCAGGGTFPLLPPAFFSLLPIPFLSAAVGLPLIVDWFSSCVVPNVAKKSLSGMNPTGL